MSSQQNVFTMISSRLQLTQGLIEAPQIQKASESTEEAGTISRNYPVPSLLVLRYQRLKKVMKRRSVSIF